MIKILTISSVMVIETTGSERSEAEEEDDIDKEKAKAKENDEENGGNVAYKTYVT